MITCDEIKADNRNPEIGYIHYSVAKREGIKAGGEFEIQGLGRFTAVEYVDWRPDINARFSGFSVKEVKK